MRLSARVDYALRASAELAAAAGSGTAGHPVTAVQLAEAQQIPPKFLENILGQLRRSGIIRSQRGPEGGYWLAKPADQITLADIIRAIDGPLLGVRGERPEHVGYSGAAQSLQEVWIALRASERAILEEVTLHHIAEGALPDSVQRLTSDPKAWDSPAYS
jgi:Rrf2 family protein